MPTYTLLHTRYCSLRSECPTLPANLGGFLLHLSDDELLDLSRHCEEFEAEQATDALLEDLVMLCHQILLLETAEVPNDASGMLDALLRLSLGVSLARLARLGFLELAMREVRLGDGGLPATQPTDKAYLLLGAPKGQFGVVLH